MMILVHVYKHLIKTNKPVNTLYTNVGRSTAQLINQYVRRIEKRNEAEQSEPKGVRNKLELAG